MLISRFLAWTLPVAMVVAGAGAASGQNYPNKAIRIVTSAAGGTVDLIARIIAPGLSGALGQSVVTENRPTIIAIETVAKAPPDGYTLLVAAGTLWIGPLLQKVPYNSTRDFSPISMATSSSNILVVHASLPVTAVRELIALAKSRPGELNFSVGPPGSYPFLAANLFKSMAGLDIVSVSYKGSGEALTALLSGEVHLTFGTPGSLATHVKSKRLRALAVTSAEPSALASGLPTLAASGVPGYEAVASQGVFAPAGTPTGIVNQLNQEIVRFINRTDVKEKFFSLGLETVGSSPERLAAAMQSEISKWGKLIKAAGIYAE